MTYAADALNDVMNDLNTTQGDVHDLRSDVTDLAEKLDALLASRLCCAERVGQNQLAQRRGTPEDQLPQINAAFMVVNGMSVCPDHVQFNSPLLVQP